MALAALYSGRFFIHFGCEKCKRRGRLRKARLVEQYGAYYGVARLRETLIQDCAKFGNWDDPCRAYFVGLKERWKKQPYDHEPTKGKSAPSSIQSNGYSASVKVWPGIGDIRSI